MCLGLLLRSGCAHLTDLRDNVARSSPPEQSDRALPVPQPPREIVDCSRTPSHLRVVPLYRLLLLIVSLTVGIGCASRDAQPPTFRMGDYRQLLNQQKSLAASAPTSTQDQPTLTADEYQQIGDRHFQQNDLAMAFVHYNKALYLEPDQADLRYKKGLVFLKRGLATDALQEFQAVLELEPGAKSAVVYQGMGQAFLLMRDLETAEKQFRRAIHFDTNLGKAYHFLGIIYDHQQHFEKAISAYETSIALKQDDAARWNNLGVSYYKNGDYDKAIQTFERASTLVGAHAQTYNNLGLSLAKRGRYEEALRAFTKGGDAAKAYNNLGVVYLAEGLYREATAAFEKAMALSPRYYPEASDNLDRVRQELQKPRPRDGK